MLCMQLCLGLEDLPTFTRIMEGSNFGNLLYVKMLGQAKYPGPIWLLLSSFTMVPQRV
jgi:hypothetical protein